MRYKNVSSSWFHLFNCEKCNKSGSGEWIPCYGMLGKVSGECLEHRRKSSIRYKSNLRKCYYGEDVSSDPVPTWAGPRWLGQLTARCVSEDMLKHAHTLRVPILGKRDTLPACLRLITYNAISWMAMHNFPEGIHSPIHIKCYIDALVNLTN